MSQQKNEICNELIGCIDSYNYELEPSEVGTVVRIADGVAQISGLHNVMVGEMIVFSDATKGLVLNLERDVIGAVVLGGLCRHSARRLCAPQR